MKVLLLSDLPLGTRVRTTSGFIREGMFVHLPKFSPADFSIRSTIIGRRQRDKITFLGYPTLPAHLKYAHATAEQMERYLDFQFMDKADELYPRCWSVFGDTWCILDEFHPEQKCNLCQIPLPHFKKANPIVCSSCQFLQGL